MARTQGILAHRRSCSGTGTGLSHYVFLEKEALKRPQHQDSARARVPSGGQAENPRPARRK